ncbi:MAG: hypothetical protein PHY16_05690 [Methylobacter sp.]|nr:hypothetical protein [Methylobacter sp.]
MKHPLFCLLLFFIALTVNSEESQYFLGNNELKQAQFLSKSNNELKNRIIVSLNAENSPEKARVENGNRNSKAIGNSQRIGIGTGGGIVKQFNKSKRLGVGTGGGNVQPRSKTERLGAGTGNKPKPKAKSS